MPRTLNRTALPFQTTTIGFPETSVTTNLRSVTSHKIEDFKGYRGSTVVKILRYKSEGRWFDPRWFHLNFALT
jgi:hypothetical protein